LGAVDVKFDTFFLREVRRGGFQRFQALAAAALIRCWRSASSGMLFVLFILLCRPPSLLSVLGRGVML
jgi:hypothetical protein